MGLLLGEMVFCQVSSSLLCLDLEPQRESCKGSSPLLLCGDEKPGESKELVQHMPLLKPNFQAALSLLTRDLPQN